MTETAVCKWCKRRIVPASASRTGYAHADSPGKGFVGCDKSGSTLAEPSPAVPAQVPIPEDLKAIHYACKFEHRALAGPFTAELIERVARAEATVAELVKIILWADGRGDDFPTRKPGEGLYWWRKELMQRARRATGKES